MNDGSDDMPVHGTVTGLEPADETPVQRALRLKRAKQDARPKPPRGGRFQREQAAGVAAGASRPWTHK